MASSRCESRSPSTITRSNCGRLSARSSDSSRACVRFMTVSLCMASAVNSASRRFSASISPADASMDIRAPC